MVAQVIILQPFSQLKNHSFKNQSSLLPVKQIGLPHGFTTNFEMTLVGIN